MEKKIHGKFRLNASTILMPRGRKIDAEVYIHLKGYARARVSHIDIEKIGSEELFMEEEVIFSR